MSAEHRYLRGDTKEIELPVHGNTVIEKGDLVVIARIAGAVTASAAKQSTADYYCYPLSCLCEVTPVYFANNFAGVAMKGSPSGTTENIPIATAGVFRFPQYITSGVTAGWIVSACSNNVTANVLVNQVVAAGSKPVMGVSTLAVGICCKTAAAATNVDFILHTRFSGATYTSLDNVGQLG